MLENSIIPGSQGKCLWEREAYLDVRGRAFEKERQTLTCRDRSHSGPPTLSSPTVPASCRQDCDIATSQIVLECCWECGCHSTASLAQDNNSTETQLLHRAPFHPRAQCKKIPLLQPPKQILRQMTIPYRLNASRRQGCSDEDEGAFTSCHDGWGFGAEEIIKPEG